MDALVSRYNSLCTPAKVFAVLQLLGIAASVSAQSSKGALGGVLASLLGGGIVMYILTWMLNLLCQHGHITIAWILAIGPPILFLLLGAGAGIFAWMYSKKKKKNGGGKKNGK